MRWQTVEFGLPVDTRRVTTAENHLIQSLPRTEGARLLSLCEPVELVLSDIVCEAGEPSRHVHFPIDGFISLIKPVDEHVSLEVGMVGREGMLGAHLALGIATSPLRAVVQGAGLSRRIGVKAFRQELARSPALQRGIHRYVYVLMAQLATSAACARFHLIKPRLARWLLMTQDRSHADAFQVTQEFLAYMLGVRRVGVTVAATVLQRSGLISYRRGVVSVIDRAGLEAAACSCYLADRQSYDALLQRPA